MKEKEMLTIKELQELWGISHNTAYKLAKTPGFPAIQLGKKILITKADLEKWLKQNYNSHIAL